MTRIVIAAFDGLQMWQVVPEVMPNLAAFARDGVRFERHHPMYPSVTRLNAASMVTGCFPGTHGIAGNRMVFRDFDAGAITEVLEPQLRKVDAATNGGAFLAATLAERLAVRGLDYAAVVSGTSGNAYCHAPNAGRTGGATIHPEFCLPDELYGSLKARFGPWPAESVPNTARLERATGVFLEYVVGERRSDVGLIWYSEPDKSQHAHGVDSAVARDALRSADREFRRLLAGLPEDVDVLVVSDHGYSTVSNNIDIAAELRDAGFTALGEPGGVGGAPNGGAVLLYMTEPENALARKLIDWATAQPWCGTVLAAERVGEIGGTLPASLAGMDGPRGPDLAISTHWRIEDGAAVASGPSFGDLRPPQGDHGSMSRTEMRNTLIARGPQFKNGVCSGVPSGNVDLLPTVLQLLGIDDAGPADGRVLSEALADRDGPAGIETTDHRASRAGYEQYVRVSTVDGVSYVDEGNRVA